MSSINGLHLLLRDEYVRVAAVYSTITRVVSKATYPVTSTIGLTGRGHSLRTR
ncbi:hypothetical protein [Kribbella sp. C-35]|uniref:hypothetical protein n=1 Tax=Kribbella sp. C-35 TaxID=2789276 RepID=UPI00397E8DF9